MCRRAEIIFAMASTIALMPVTFAGAFADLPGDGDPLPEASDGLSFVGSKPSLPTEPGWSVFSLPGVGCCVDSGVGCGVGSEVGAAVGDEVGSREGVEVGVGAF
jgi:hypothetical protein